MKVGYARVSSSGQSLDVQIDKIKEAGCEKVFQEKHTGTTGDRPQLRQCIDFVREGDVLVVTKLDRFARSVGDLHSLATELEKKGVAFRVLDQAIDTTTPTGRLLFNVLGAIAQFENELRAERQAEGIERAMRDGVKFGRKPALTQEQCEKIAQMRQGGASRTEIAQEFCVSPSTVDRAIRGLRKPSSREFGVHLIEAEYEPKRGSQ